MYRASQLIKNMTTLKGKEIAIAYVSKTDTWERPFLPQTTKDEFAEVAEKYKDTLKPDTVKVAMKWVVSVRDAYLEFHLHLKREAEHPSQNDAAKHYSALKLDKDEKVIALKHYYKQVWGTGLGQQEWIWDHHLQIERVSYNSSTIWLGSLILFYPLVTFRLISKVNSKGNLPF